MHLTHELFTHTAGRVLCYPLLGRSVAGAAPVSELFQAGHAPTPRYLLVGRGRSRASRTLAGDGCQGSQYVCVQPNRAGHSLLKPRRRELHGQDESHLQPVDVFTAVELEYSEAVDLGDTEHEEPYRSRPSLQRRLSHACLQHGVDDDSSLRRVVIEY